MSALLTGKVRDFAVKRRFVDDARSVRNVHRQSVPRMGGIAFVSSWLMATALMLALSPTLREAFWIRRPRSIVFLFGAFAATALGVIDDVRGLRARYKLAAQAAIGLLLCAAGFTVHDIQLPGGILVPLGYFAVPLTVLWIAGVMNAMNLIDGLDGLAAGIVAIGGAALFLYDDRLFKRGFLPIGNVGPLVACIAVGVCLGFLPWNFHWRVYRYFYWHVRRYFTWYLYRQGHIRIQCEVHAPLRVNRSDGVTAVYEAVSDHAHYSEGEAA